MTSEVARRSAFGNRAAPVPEGDRRAPRVAFFLPDLGIPLFSSIKAGGVHARAMIQAFIAEGAEVDVYALRPGRPDDQLPPGVTVHKVRQGRMRRALYRRYRRAKMPVWATGMEALLSQADFLLDVRAQMNRSEVPDLIYARHSWLTFALPWLQRRFGAPMYLEVNALFSLEKEQRGELAYPRLTRRFENSTLRAAVQVLPVSRRLLKDIVAFGIPEKRVTLMMNAVDLDLFDARLHASGKRELEGVFRIGVVSGFRRYHGLTTLLRALGILRHEVPGACVRLIGEGPMKAEVEAEAAQLGLNDSIEITGAVPHRSVPALLADCDVCVAPFEGGRNQYNCPMKLFEYIALKVPVVASRWGEIGEILGDGETALLHEPGSSRDLASKLLLVHQDPEGARRRAEAAFSIARNHTWRGHARRILNHVLRRKEDDF